MTDDGIQKLCVTGNCKSICYLSIGRCFKVTTKGIKIALDNLPHLRVLCHRSLVECLAEVAQTAIDQKLKIPKYSLTSLYILSSKDYYKTGNLQKSLILCPNVTKVNLSMSNDGRFEGTEILSLVSLKKVCSIDILHFDCFSVVWSHNVQCRIDRGINFDSVFSLPQKLGCRIKRLNLQGLLVVDIPAIMKFCPNLEILIICNCKNNQSTDQTNAERPILKNLQALYLRNFFTSENLFALLSSPSISRLKISECDTLTDSVLRRASNLHSFRNLKYLYLYACSSVTKKGIDIFLQESNPLTEIFLYTNPVPHRSRITREDLIVWNNNPIWIKKNWQFNFILEHYPFRPDSRIFLGRYWKDPCSCGRPHEVGSCPFSLNI